MREKEGQRKETKIRSEDSVTKRIREKRKEREAEIYGQT